MKIINRDSVFLDIEDVIPNLVSFFNNLFANSSFVGFFPECKNQKMRKKECLSYLLEKSAHKRELFLLQLNNIVEIHSQEIKKKERQEKINKILEKIGFYYSSQKNEIIDLKKKEKSTVLLENIHAKSNQLKKDLENLDIDFCIITALDIERDSVNKIGNLKREYDSNNRFCYFGKILNEKSNQELNVIHYFSDVGNVETSITIGEIIRNWNPKFIIMVGICGGINKNKVEIGDILIAKDILYYPMSKIENEKIEIRTIQILTSPDLKNIFKNYPTQPEDEKWIEEIPNKEKYFNDLKRTPNTHFGTIFSGETVVKSKEQIQKLLVHSPKAIGIDMESWGIYYTAKELKGFSNTLTIRGVSDLADKPSKTKWDKFHHFAADAAATFLFYFLRYGPIYPILSKLKTTKKNFNELKNRIISEIVEISFIDTIDNFLEVNLLQTDETEAIARGQWPSIRDIENNDVVITEKIKKIINDLFKIYFEKFEFIWFLTGDMASGKTTIAKLFSFEIYQMIINNNPKMMNWLPLVLKKGSLHSISNLETLERFLEKIYSFLFRNKINLLIICEDAHLSPDNYVKLIKKLDMLKNKQPLTVNDKGKTEKKSYIHLLVITRNIFWLTSRAAQLNYEIEFHQPYTAPIDINILKSKMFEITENDMLFVAENMVTHFQKRRTSKLSIKEINDVFSLISNKTTNLRNLFTIRFFLMAYTGIGDFNIFLFFDLIMKYINNICLNVAHSISNKDNWLDNKNNTACVLLYLSILSKYEIPLSYSSPISIENSEVIIEKLCNQGHIICEQNKAILEHPSLAIMFLTGFMNYNERLIDKKNIIPIGYENYSYILRDLINKIEKNLTIYNLNSISDEEKVFIHYLSNNENNYSEIIRLLYYQLPDEVFSVLFHRSIPILVQLLENDLKNESNSLYQIVSFLEFLELPFINLEFSHINEEIIEFLKEFHQEILTKIKCHTTSFVNRFLRIILALDIELANLIIESITDEIWCAILENENDLMVISELIKLTAKANLKLAFSRVRLLSSSFWLSKIKEEDEILQISQFLHNIYLVDRELAGLITKTIIKAYTLYNKIEDNKFDQISLRVMDLGYYLSLQKINDFNQDDFWSKQFEANLELWEIGVMLENIFNKNPIKARKIIKNSPIKLLNEKLDEENNPWQISVFIESIALIDKKIARELIPSIPIYKWRNKFNEGELLWELGWLIESLEKIDSIFASQLLNEF